MRLFSLNRGTLIGLVHVESSSLNVSSSGRILLVKVSMWIVLLSGLVLCGFVVYNRRGQCGVVCLGLFCMLASRAIDENCSIE